MRVISYSHNGSEGLGVMVDDKGFVALSSAAPELPTTMMGLLNTDDWQAKAAAAVEGKSADLSIDDVQLLPLVSDTPVIWCVGVNYKEHQDETGRGAQEEPMFFIRTNHGLIGAYDPIIRPNVSDMLDFEGELAVIIGKGGRHISKEKAHEHIAGYSIFNDGTIRDWQRHTIQFCPGKNFEGTGPFGPWMMTPDEFGDPYAQELTTRLNGETVQHTSIADMDHKIDKQIEYLSTVHTLRPGDVISTGTPGGVGSRREPPLWMKPGDTVSVEVTGLGIIENKIEQES
ncbi:MAG: fumarylacetoacetate hydrolase family protein [Rhodospirillaceae bacterium]|nr:fumarylacetoacetate hydrolase family protein [Rhodospirillaceae bacterium]MBT4589204.1 fumarylacetoacetate hydrolase family protein [Rhodospirillaceae bacterium]MBT4938140.1 fumarylacetoacetate hydrolase family protein [Rhodospirillaceae bacterium]MBT5941767.1 fumarylacetoacetate hydrolase family protein [Rhodospirillaceae bacterium]MBT7267677.1 fumarylacetoacetate hydrolase family protein [Rhodospirillaceae bacterium]